MTAPRARLVNFRVYKPGERLAEQRRLFGVDEPKPVTLKAIVPIRNYGTARLTVTLTEGVGA